MKIEVPNSNLQYSASDSHFSGSPGDERGGRMTQDFSQGRKHKFVTHL